VIHCWQARSVEVNCRVPGELRPRAINTPMPTAATTTTAATVVINQTGTWGFFARLRAAGTATSPAVSVTRTA